MNFLLKITEKDYLSPIIETNGFSETLLFGLEIVLIGIGTVFAVIILLWAALSLFNFFFKKGEATNSIANQNTNERITDPVAVQNKSDEEIIAVIAAAIAMAESEGNGAKFRVVSFRRK